MGEQIVLAVDRLFSSDEIEQSQINVAAVVLCGLKLMDSAMHQFNVAQVPVCARWLRKELRRPAPRCNGDDIVRTKIHPNDHCQLLHELQEFVLRAYPLDHTGNSSRAGLSYGMDGTLTKLATDGHDSALANHALHILSCMISFGIIQDTEGRRTKYCELGVERLLRRCLLLGFGHGANDAISFLQVLAEQEDVLNVLLRSPATSSEGSSTTSEEERTVIEELICHMKHEQVVGILETLVRTELRVSGASAWEEIWESSQVLAAIHRSLQGPYVPISRASTEEFFTENGLTLLADNCLFTGMLPPQLISRTPLLSEVCRHAFENLDGMAITIMTMLVAKELSQVPPSSDRLKDVRREGWLDEERFEHVVLIETQSEVAYIIDCVRHQGHLGRLWSNPSLKKDERKRIFVDELDRGCGPCPNVLNTRYTGRRSGQSTASCWIMSGSESFTYLNLVFLLFKVGGIAEIVTEEARWSAGVSIVLEFAEDSDTTSLFHKVMALEWLLKMFNHVSTNPSAAAGLNREALVELSVRERVTGLKALLIRSQEGLSRKKRKATSRGVEIADRLLQTLEGELSGRGRDSDSGKK